MPNHRIQRTNEDIRMVLAEKIKDLKDPRVHQGMISVVRTETTGDLKFCKVFISVLGDYDKKEMQKGLKSSAGYLRNELASSLNLRNTPELTFVLDDSIAHGAYINDLISKLDIKHDDD